MVGCDFNPRWFWTSKNIQDVLKVLPQCEKPLFHICSGVSNIGDIRVDRSYIDLPLDFKYRIEYQGSCNVKGDMVHLPFKDGVAGSVLCDPPYKYDFTEEGLISELIRICRPKGKIIFISPWIPNSKLMKLINIELWKVGKDRPYHKVRSLFYKSNGQLGDYVNGCAETSACPK